MVWLLKGLWHGISSMFTETFSLMRKGNAIIDYQLWKEFCCECTSWSESKPDFKSWIFYLPAVWPRHGTRSLWSSASYLQCQGKNSTHNCSIQFDDQHWDARNAHKSLSITLALPKGKNHCCRTLLLCCGCTGSSRKQRYGELAGWQGQPWLNENGIQQKERENK